MNSATQRVLLVLGLIVAAVGLFLVLQHIGFIDYATDQEAVRQSVQSLGVLGPALLIGLMVLAIVASPIPSAPIGLAAGAAYGPLWGTVITIVGAAAGAIIAFSIARFVAYDVVRQWRAVRKPLEWLEKHRSQNWLMGAVFLSRLLPFISFDAVSYAAGLTHLSLWRFALASIAGIVPISILLAYGGDALLVHGSENISFWLLVAGGITLVPFLLKPLWSRLRRRGR
jgi:uncharacterized membrane protein YdjX (TVP38/TMEM64 family)